MNSCFECEYHIYIPEYLRKEYEKAGIDPSTKEICSLTCKKVNGRSCACSSFIEKLIDDDLRSEIQC